MLQDEPPTPVTLLSEQVVEEDRPRNTRKTENPASLGRPYPSSTQGAEASPLSFLDTSRLHRATVAHARLALLWHLAYLWLAGPGCLTGRAQATPGQGRLLSLCPLWGAQSWHHICYCKRAYTCYPGALHLSTQSWLSCRSPMLFISLKAHRTWREDYWFWQP
jgi:hypothetical protein